MTATKTRHDELINAAYGAVFQAFQLLDCAAAESTSSEQASDLRRRAKYFKRSLTKITELQNRRQRCRKEKVQ